MTIVYGIAETVVPYSVWEKVGDSSGWGVTVWTDTEWACSHCVDRYRVGL